MLFVRNCLASHMTLPNQAALRGVGSKGVREVIIQLQWSLRSSVRDTERLRGKSRKMTATRKSVQQLYFLKKKNPNGFF